MIAIVDELALLEETSKDVEWKARILFIQPKDNHVRSIEPTHSIRECVCVCACVFVFEGTLVTLPSRESNRKTDAILWECSVF